MKLLSFETDGRARVGVSLPEGMLDLTGALSITHPQLDRTDSLLAMIQSHIDIDAFGEESVQRLRREQRLRDHLVGNFKWLPPIPRPPKILALALNYREHIEESKLSFFDEPIIFAKYANNLIAHDDEIVLPPFPQQVDEEHELALVVGRDCRHIRPSQASGYIFGYTICNDVSARDRQRERLRMGQPYAYAKNFATFCPMGPWIVTANEIGDPRKLNMTVRVNGETRRTGNTSAMIFDPYEVLAY
ncbi:MAG: fumarylacetoacetate hydrolase family protein, partial [Candidatus Binataceae bacterium]